MIRKLLIPTLDHSEVLLLPKEEWDLALWLQALQSFNIHTTFDDDIMFLLTFKCYLQYYALLSLWRVVDGLRYYGLYCNRIVGRIFGYANLNHILRLALVTAGVLAQVEHYSLAHHDKKRPYKMALMPCVSQVDLWFGITPSKYGYVCRRGGCCISGD